MMAADTSSLMAFLGGGRGPDVDLVRDAMRAGQLVLPPVVITELLSDPGAAQLLDDQLPAVGALDVKDGYWERAGHARRTLGQRGLKAKVADALIAQSCIDHDVALITRDRDFRHFAKHCGLKLA
jgi:predicted nucleic acid-binding protein